MNSIYAELWQAARSMVILKVISDLGRPATLAELVAVTRGDDETISKYLSLLAKQGLVTRVSAHAGWMLTAAGMNFVAPSQAVIAVSPELSPAPVNSPDSALSTIKQFHSFKVNPVVESQKSGDSNGIGVPGLPGSQEESQNWTFFEQIGVTRNARSLQIAARLPNQVIRAQWQKLKDAGKPWPGLLIKILSNTGSEHPHDCRCQACDRKRRARYAEWEQPAVPRRRK